MTTISVPIPQHIEAFIEKHIQEGYATNKADVVRKALTLLAEQRAINDVLEAEKEPNLKGDLKELAKQLRIK
jgi:Arc/MetJ-type ribon-helix-helix transcriptional regulator